LLKSRFPKNIELRAAYVDGDIVAGTIVYKYGHVWHTQYLASSEIGKKVGGLDFVIYSLIDEARKEGCEYLSFGASTTQAGKVLNEGLIWQKESYGARGLTHDYYALNLTNES